MSQALITQKSEDYSLLDEHTGEILDFYQTKKVNLDEFIMVFFSCIPKIMELKGVALKILICCWKASSFNPINTTQGNIIVNNAKFKEYVRSCGVTALDASIDNAFSTLRKKGFLLKRCRGEYMLNPEYFFKGTISQRSKLRFSVIVDPTKDGIDTKSSTCFFIRAAKEVNQ